MLTPIQAKNQPVNILELISQTKFSLVVTSRLNPYKFVYCNIFKNARKVLLLLPLYNCIYDFLVYRIENHLEERQGNALVLSDAYKYYVDSCVSANSVARSLPEFCKVNPSFGTRHQCCLI